jgi:hypothetical protein
MVLKDKCHSTLGNHIIVISHQSNISQLTDKMQAYSFMLYSLFMYF